MSVVPRIVLVGHDASATGAPAVSAAWVRWAARTGQALVEVRLDRGGPLVASFAAATPTRVRPGAADRLAIGAAAALAPALNQRLRRVAAWPARRRLGAADTVVASSVASWRSAASLADPARLVLWLHELDGVADRIVSADGRDALLAATSTIVAVSERVAEMAVERWGAPAGQVTVVPSFVDPPPERGALSAGTAAPPHLLAVGSLVPRKGADHVVAVVALLARSRPALRAAWVGGTLTTPYADLVATDVATAGLGTTFTLAGQVDDVEPWWPVDGVLLHLAREDPAPLVVLEAALRAIPVVTWDTGGAADLLRAAGLPHLVAAPGDIVAVAEAVEGLLADPVARAEAGAALRAASAVRTTERVAPDLLAAFVEGRS